MNNATGMVTSIQRFSLNDGPGIRTTVFFKGCNLRCVWCHNPETIRVQNDLMFYPDKCIGCGHCLPVCPAEAIGTGGAFDRAKCTGCGACAEICFPGAREMAGHETTVEEVMAEIRQDVRYYENSGGGVTLSGGEVFCQNRFADALVSACAAENIPAAVETNLLGDFDSIAAVLKKVSLVMFDVKLFDSAAHRQYTGSGNEVILANIRRLDAMGIPLIARTPLIPGITDTVENISAIAGFLSGLQNLQYYELLNFNPLGGAKYPALNMTDECTTLRPLTAEQLQRLREVAAASGIQVKIG